MASTAAVPLLAGIGVSGLRQWAGYIAEEMNPALKGRRRINTYKSMMREPLIAASMLGTELLMRQVPLTFTPADETPAAIEAADWLKGAMLDDMVTPWPETLAEILTMREYGWSTLNVIYKRRQGNKRDAYAASRFTDGAYGWAAWEPRSQDSLERWLFDEQQRATGFVQQPDTGGTFTIPLEACVHFRLGQAKGNPEGISLLNNVWEPWYDKKQIRAFQNIGIERDLVGYPVLYVPREICEASDPAMVALRQGYERMIQRIRRNEDEGGILPAFYDDRGNPSYKLELLQSGGQRQFDLPAIIQQLNLEMLIALFTDMLLMGHERVGTLSLSDNKTALLGYALSSIMDSICAVLNRQAVTPLWRLNGFAPEVQPVVGHDDIENTDVTQMSQFIAAASGSGLNVLDYEDEIWRRAGFTPAPAEEQTA